MSQPTRVYSNGNIVLEWYADKCIHCGNCTSGLPQVFNLDARPWVNMQGATSDEIVAQTKECPSGAIHIREGK